MLRRLTDDIHITSCTFSRRYSAAGKGAALSLYIRKQGR